MKKISKILLILVLILINIKAVVADEEKNLVNIYLFHSNTCSHCKQERKVLKELEKKYSNIKIYSYEISDKDNLKLLTEVAKLYDTEAAGPCAGRSLLWIFTDSEAGAARTRLCNPAGSP